MRRCVGLGLLEKRMLMREEQWRSREKRVHTGGLVSKVAARQ